MTVYVQSHVPAASDMLEWSFPRNYVHLAPSCWHLEIQDGDGERIPVSPARLSNNWQVDAMRYVSTCRSNV